MIKNLQIKNFKGISELNINNLSRVNLIGGSNNVGKTSLLEALFLFHDRVNPHMFLRLHGFRGVQSVELTPESMWAPMFSTFDMKSDIEISIDTDNNESNKLIFRINNKYLKHEVIRHQPTFGQPQQIKTNIEPIPSISLDIIYSSNKKKQVAHLLIESGSIGMHIDSIELKPTEAVFMAATSRNNAQEDAIRFGKIDLIGK